MSDFEKLYYSLIRGEDFDCLYEKYHQIIWTILKKDIDDATLIEEIEYTIYSKIIMSISKVKNPKGLQKYINKLIKTTYLDAIKKEKSKKKYICLPLEEIDNYQSIYQNNKFFKIEEMKYHLYVDEYYIILYKIFLNMSFMEISKILNIPQTTIRRKYNKAIQKLRKELGDSGYPA